MGFNSGFKGLIYNSEQLSIWLKHTPTRKFIITVRVERFRNFNASGVPNSELSSQSQRILKSTINQVDWTTTHFFIYCNFRWGIAKYTVSVIFITHVPGGVVWVFPACPWADSSKMPLAMPYIYLSWHWSRYWWHMQGLIKQVTAPESLMKQDDNVTEENNVYSTWLCDIHQQLPDSKWKVRWW